MKLTDKYKDRFKEFTTCYKDSFGCTYVERHERYIFDSYDTEYRIIKEKAEK
jgi:hypothetical protein